MRIYLTKDVLTVTKERLTRLYSEEKNVVVCTSGGKDSTVLLELAVSVCKELGKLPIKAMFLDQESEYQGTIDYMRYLKTRKEEVDLNWYQIPFVLTNSTSLKEDNYLHCWKEGEKWMREKDPESIHENPTKETRFHKLAAALTDYMFKPETHFNLIGLRAAESLNRRTLMHKTIPVYKDIRWSSHSGKTGYNMYPIYDWEVKDVWKYIYENNIVYNDVYDKMYKSGNLRRKMRVSSLIHEMGHWALWDLHEIEPDTYSKLSERVDGVSDYHSLDIANFIPYKLPIAFKSWIEYRNYLLYYLIDPARQEQFYKHFRDDDDEIVAKEQVGSIVMNDYEGILMTNAKAARRQETV